MKIVKITLSILLLFFVILSYAQNDNDAKRTLRLYSSIEFKKENASGSSSLGFIISTKKYSINIGKFTPAFSFQRKKVEHEFSIPLFSVSRNKQFELIQITGMGVTIPTSQSVLRNQLTLGFRYSVFHDFLKLGNKISGGVGIGLMPYYSFENFIPLTSALYPYKIHSISLQNNFISRLKFNTKKRLFFLLDYSLIIADYQYKKHTINNPLLPSDESLLRTQKFIAYPKIHELRFALGIQI